MAAAHKVNLVPLCAAAPPAAADAEPTLLVDTDAQGKEDLLRLLKRWVWVWICSHKGAAGLGKVMSRGSGARPRWEKVLAPLRLHNAH